MKASELFVISALILLVFVLASRFFSSSGLGIGIPFRGTGYVLPPSTICVGQATALCFVATIYSLWMLPFNRTATLFHFLADGLWHWGFLAGVLSSAKLTNSNVGGLCSPSSSSADSSYF